MTTNTISASPTRAAALLSVSSSSSSQQRLLLPSSISLVDRRRRPRMMRLTIATTKEEVSTLRHHPRSSTTNSKILSQKVRHSFFISRGLRGGGGNVVDNDDDDDDDYDTTDVESASPAQDTTLNNHIAVIFSGGILIYCMFETRQLVWLVMDHHLTPIYILLIVVYYFRYVKNLTTWKELVVSWEERNTVWVILSMGPTVAIIYWLLPVTCLLTWSKILQTVLGCSKVEEYVLSIAAILWMAIQVKPNSVNNRFRIWITDPILNATKNQNQLPVGSNDDENDGKINNNSPNPKQCQGHRNHKNKRHQQPTSEKGNHRTPKGRQEGSYPPHSHHRRRKPKDRDRWSTEAYDWLVEHGYIRDRFR